MIRHPSLIPLSHDHHLGLVAAQRLKRGDAAYKESPSIEESVAELWRTELDEHFAQEERWLFGLEVEGECRAMIDRALAEHAAMRELIAQIGRGENVSDAARALGALLEKHIRFEERELFERLQAEVGEERLGEVGKGIESMRTPRTCR
jgi:hypothetical protein